MSVLNEYLTELSTNNVLTRLKGLTAASLKSLTNRQLLDYHRKCHMLYSGNIKRKPTNKEFINSIVDLHDMIVKEMKRRKLNHTSPLKKLS